MIDVLSGQDAECFTQLFQKMHRLRHRVFKDRLDWSVHSQNGLERDEFDIPDAYYLLAFDEAEELVGTWRMLPTVKAYMLRDVFPQLLDGQPAPEGPTIWEGSRFAVDCGYNGRQGLGALHHITAQIFCAVVEFCLAKGIDEVVTVYDTRVSRLLQRIGCHHTWRTPMKRVGNTVAMAGRFDANERVLDVIRRVNNIEGSVIRSAPWDPIPIAA